MKFIIFITFLFFIGIVYAQFPDDIPYQSFTSELPSLPNFLETVEDISVPNEMTIKRITQFVPEWDWYPTHEYAKIQPWNADASIYKFYSVAIYNAQTHEIIRQLPGGSIYPSYWSNTNADILYGFKENGDIKSYSIATEQIDLLGHIYNDDATQTDYELVKLGPGEGNIDKNDHYVAFVGKQGIDMDVIVYDLQVNQVIHRKLFAGAWGNNPEVPEYVDWVSVSQSGDYVGIMWNHNTTSEANPFNTHFGVEIYNTTDMQFLRRIATYGNHGDFGYAQNGDEVFVQFWGDTGTLNMFYLNRMERVVLSSSADFSGEGHVSCRNINRPGWAYVSQDEVAHTGQIIAMKLDDSGLVEHFGHHYSTASSYLKSPMPCPNPNGNKIMFKSDFGDESNDVIYVFESSKTEVASVEEVNSTTVNIYPNPTNSILNIQSKIKITQVEIYSIYGQLIKLINPNNTSLKLNLDYFKKGVYLISFIDVNGNVFNDKIMIN
jgi:hypothetical protein